MAQKKRFKPPLRVICTIGALAHNRAFTSREVAEYVAFGAGGQANAMKAASTVKWMLKHKLLKPGDKRGTYYPTGKGWNTLEKACQLKPKKL